MGNEISTTAPEGSLAAAGTIVGFISFAFTLATFLRVSWDNLRTIWSTGTEVHSLLPNLKQALFEERDHLRQLRRRCRAQYEEGAFDVLAYGLRAMIKEFENLERPFLKPELRGYDEKGYYAHQHPEDVYEGQYKRVFYIKDRYLWLRRRSDARSIAERLTRVQTRRVARQTKDLAVDTRYIIRSVQDIQDRLESMSRGPGGDLRRRESTRG